jgi:hypothetical protein
MGYVLPTTDDATPDDETPEVFMNAVDENKVLRTVSAHTGMDAKISNLLGYHTGQAVKYFEGAAVERAKWAKNGGIEAEVHGPVVNQIKSRVLPALKRVMSDAKSAGRGVADFQKQLGRLQNYNDVREFRTKAASLLASSRALDESTNSFRLALSLGGGAWLGAENVAVVATVASCKAFSDYYNALKVELGRL